MELFHADSHNFKVRTKDLILFTRNLSVMLRAGLTITESLEINAEQSKGNLKIILTEISAQVVKGSSLNQTLAKYPRVFSIFYRESVSAGEASGKLEENLLHIAVELEKEAELRAKIKEAMFYPLIVLSLSVVLGIILAFVVLPKITPIFKGLKIDLPLSTRFLIWLSEQIDKHGFLILGIIFISLAFSAWLWRQKFFKPLSNWAFLHLPLIKNIVVHKNLAQFSLTLGTLIQSGLGINEALAVSSKTLSNYYFRKITRGLTKRTEQGEKLSRALKDYPEYFPKLCVSMIEVGERSGQMSEELIELSYLYEREVDSATKVIATAVEPLLLLIIGLVVGGLAISIITPIYEITGNVY